MSANKTEKKKTIEKDIEERTRKIEAVYMEVRITATSYELLQRLAKSLNKKANSEIITTESVLDTAIHLGLNQMKDWDKF